MEVDKLNILLEKYYSGDILPDEYQILLNCLKESTELNRTLEAERRILLTVESCEPYAPEGLEQRLIASIDRRSHKKHIITRLVCSGAAAAIVVVLITIASFFDNGRHDSESEPIARTVSSNDHYEMWEASKSGNLISSDTDMPADCEFPSTNEDLEGAVQIVDNALMEVLTNVRLARNDVEKIMDNIEINQILDFNTL